MSMSSHPLLSSILALGAVSLAACSSAPSPAAKTGQSAATTDACLADAAWLHSSTLPTEVSNPTSICSFEQFMWQSMLALVQPTTADPAILNFETWMPSYGIFVKDGAPTAWGQEPPNTCATGSKTTGKPRRLYSDIIKQAGADQPLIDQKREFVYYGMSVNQSAYDMFTACQLYKANCAGPLKPGNQGIDLIKKYPDLALPSTAVELKTSWMIVDDATVASGRFYVVPGWIQRKGGPCREVNLGLTGMHIVSKTPSFPALIWATFEHRDNAPDCSNTSAQPPLGGPWSFFDPNCPTCTTNTYRPLTPAQICRMHPSGNSAVGTFPDDVNCSEKPSQFACQANTQAMLAESTHAIDTLNAGVRAFILAPPVRIDRVWANYELVGNVWTIGGTVPPDLRAQQGALSAANTSMESFVQNGVAAITNPYSCLSCHNMQGPTNTQTLPPVGLSHLFDNVQMPGGCDDGYLPGTCTAFTRSH
jgi:hypothetical protein